MWSVSVRALVVVLEAPKMPSEGEREPSVASTHETDKAITCPAFLKLPQE